MRRDHNRRQGRWRRLLRAHRPACERREARQARQRVGLNQAPPLTPPLGRRGVPPELLVILAAISVQGGGGVAAQLIQRHSPLAVVALRTAFSAAILLVLRPPRRAAGSEAWRLAILLGLVMAAMNTLFYLSISRIPLGVAVTLEFSGPLLVAVAGSRRPRDFVWVALAAVGIYLLAGARLTADDALGVAAALAAGACWAAFIVVGGRLARAWPDGRGLTVSLLTGTAVVVPLAL
ncbi:MAG: EamA family transporter, partial [Chloroflexi bacterium]|nr:EamA family transporter [Chloroflexota bacterium]